MLTDKPTCGNCRFWSATDEGSGEGVCHRLPPFVLLSMLPWSSQNHTGGPDGVWPRTEDFDWCGEHKPKT
jgi:hypothetical protein